MSHKAPKRLSKRARVFYPLYIKVDEILDEKTGEKRDHMITTGPYRKDLCVTDDGKIDIYGYFKHLKFKYDEKKSKIANREKIV